jgi:two-component system phosphate regulon response regulator PhoB
MPTSKWTSQPQGEARRRRHPARSTEFRLLRHFLEHPGRVFSRERLLDSVWGQDSDIEPRTVDVHIRRLRKAINGENRSDIIRTVRSAGYALDSEERS